MPAEAPIVALCKALVDDLNENAGEFSLPFTAVRGYVPMFELMDLATRRLVVTPGAVTADAADRGHVRDTHRIAIGVLKMLTAAASDDRSDVGDLSELDAELAFVDELRRFFRPDSGSVYTLTTAAGDVQVVNAPTNDPAYDREHMRDRRQFTSVLTIEFEEVRP